MTIGATIGERLPAFAGEKGDEGYRAGKCVPIDRATLKRIGSGETEKVSSQVIIAAAQHFGVSTVFSWD